jgi:hypothetical protein
MLLHLSSVTYLPHHGIRQALRCWMDSVHRRALLLGSQSALRASIWRPRGVVPVRQRRDI